MANEIPNEANELAAQWEDSASFGSAYYMLHDACLTIDGNGPQAVWVKDARAAQNPYVARIVQECRMRGRR